MSIVIKVRVSVPVLTGDGRVDDEREGLSLFGVGEWVGGVVVLVG